MRLCVLCLTVALTLACAGAALAAGTVRLQVLSNRADLVADGNALVAVDLPAGASATGLKVSVGGRDVSSAFARRADGRIEGVIEGMRLGKNVVTATLRDGRGAKLTITNHPNGGPVFSGPQVQPWICQTSAVDALCNEPPKFTYLYKSTDPTKTDLQPYDPANPPSDVATTRTDGGVEVPFIVRDERGYQDRDRYRIETLYRPGQPWGGPWTPQSQWNHKLLITHGGSCHTSYGPTNPPWGNGALTGTPGTDDISTVALGRGYAVASTALDNSGANCNVALQAESILMLKEYMVESYGDLRHTIGEGCSGGSLAELWMDNAYPGLYDGLIATCTFPDADSTAQQIFDYALLANYFGVPISGSGTDPALGPVPMGTILHETLPERGWTTSQAAAVAGDGTANLPISWNWAFSAYSYFGLADPAGCPDSLGTKTYNAQSNPGGVRCGVLDWQINLLGPRPPSAWGAEEKKVGHGFAGVPVDNIGIQYGLKALEQGQISADQFVDLNSKIGGGDPDLRPHAERIAADEPALANAYRTGLINGAHNLDRVPIINLAGPNDPGLAHDSYRAFAIRARLDRAHGTHANQVMWQGPAVIIGDAVDLNTTALDAMDRWLAAIRADNSQRSLAAKVIADKPADIHDQCSDGVGHTIHDGICGNAIVPVYGTPRTVADEPITTDQNKCQLKALRRSDYSVTFTDPEWATLQKTFPTGVCDYSKPGVDQQPVVTWLTYLDARGNVIYGGKPLGSAPRSVSVRPKRKPSRARRSHWGPAAPGGAMLKR